VINACEFLSFGFVTYRKMSGLDDLLIGQAGRPEICIVFIGQEF
jgi:hypothetical protein